MPRKSLPTKLQSASESENDEQVQDGMDITTALQAAQDIVASNHSKREKYRKAIEAEHKGNVKGLEVKIDALFEARKAKVNKIRKAKLDQLDVLLKRRKHIESQIIASMKLLETHMSNLSKELIVVYQGREDDILEMGDYERPAQK